ncbi:MAG: DUF362 domain-containing protein [Planctomycetia bacterium]|nr:DUF362 domain-containing protein [Planctomycetia bacterium]
MAAADDSTDVPTPVVFFTREITPEKLVELYSKLGRKLEEKVAVKVHSGEPGGKHFVQPEFMKPLVDSVHGTIVECNTAYEGRRFRTEDHWEAIREHGFMEIAPVDILDEEGELELPVAGGKQIQVNYVGSHLTRYASMLVLSHFKGHLMGGFGGALKNLSIGVASGRGKGLIHGAGDPAHMWDCEQDRFLEAMADACRSVIDHYRENIVYLNVMKDLSIDCDCDSNPHAPEMADIGMLASLDPVALDQACVDLVYQSEDTGKASLIRRMEEKHAVHILEAAEELKIGSREYRLVEF